MFEALGLSAQTEAVYLALLNYPDAGTDEIAGQLNMSETQVREALDELARMSLLRDPEPGSAPLRLIDPQIGLSALLARQHAEVARRQLEIEESRAALTALLTAHAERKPRTAEPGIEHLTGIDEIRTRLMTLADSCQWEACSFMPGGAQSAESLAASRKLDAEAIDRGVRLRTLYLDSVRNDQPTLDYAMWLSERGSEVRTAPTLPLRMLIVDRKLALVPVNTEDSRAMALVISGTGVVTALYALFNSEWKAATPLGSVRRRDSEGLSTQEKQVLLLLGAGHTDEVIARRLGVSVRTARRVAADLLGRLGARSRFQAGALAAARGWIDPDDLD